MLFELRKYRLTILSIPRGPRLVRTTSATAYKGHKKEMKLTFGGDNVGGSDVFGFLGLE